MDVREKLALVVCEATQKTNYKCEFNCENKGKCAYCIVMAEQMIANGVTVQEWIPVAERLPETAGEYIVKVSYASAATALWYDPQEDVWFGDDDWDAYPVTHWMPMPRLPEEESK